MNTQAEETELHKSHEQLAIIKEASGLGVFDHDLLTGRIIWDERVREIWGVGPDEPVLHETFIYGVHPDDRARTQAVIETALDPAGDGRYHSEFRVISLENGMERWVAATGRVFFHQGKAIRFAGTAQDITIRKQAEAHQELLTEVLRILNRGEGLQSVMRETLHAIQQATGFDAVGIRLRNGENYPYFEQNGFTNEFLEKENFLCALDGAGSTVRDALGRAQLECTCGLVLSGRTDLGMSCFTAGGSFWTNRSSDLLALPREEDPRTNPRNNCIHAGYQSVGLFPVRTGQEIIGVLQLNGRREGMFTPERLAFYESMAQNIGLAVQHAISEEALRESESRYRAYFNLPMAGMAVTAPNQGWIEVNSAVCEMLGYTREELLCRTWSELTHPEDLDRDLLQFRRVLAGEIDNYSLEKRFIHKDQKVIWVNLSVHGVRSDVGEVSYIVALLNDITARKRAEKELKDSEHRYRKLVQSSPDAIIVHRDGHFLYANTAALRLFGAVGLGQLQKRNLLDLIHPDDRDAVLEKARRLGKGERISLEEVRLIPIDGRQLYVESYASRVTFGKEKALQVIIRDITERKKAEVALRESEASLRRAQQIAHLGSWEFDLVGNRLTWSDEVYRIFGLQPQEFGATYQEFLEHVHPDDRTAVDAAYSGSLRDGVDSYEIEHRVVRKRTGEIRFVQEKCQHVRNAQGQVVQSFGMVLDITERKAAQAALAENEQRYRGIVETTEEGIATHEPDGTIIYVNQRMADMLGYSREEIIGRSSLEFVDDAEREEVIRTRESLKERGSFSKERRLRRKDGSDLWTLINISPQRNASGNLLGYLAMHTDITERKQAEKRAQLLSEVTAQLLTSENPQRIVETLCRRIMEHLDCHVFFNFLADEAMGCLHLNAYAGISEEKAREIEWLDYGVAVCGCAARDRSPIVAENIHIAPDERTRLVHSYGVKAYAAHPLMDQGRVIGTLSFGSRSKSSFSEEDVGLMKTVADHVAIAIQRVRLVESLNEQARAAEAANQAKSRFLANMSHELRTPMNAILGLIDVAIPKATDSTVQDCLHTAKKSADLLLKLLNDLLDSARIESGKLELESVPFSIRRMLGQITSTLSLRASEKGLTFSSSIPDELPDAVIGDRTRLQQVLLNLAGNAVKFTERGEVQISVDAVSKAGKVTLQFSIRDTGIGIPASRLEHVFEPFTQADASMARRFGGTGLGLSISKSLIEMMGGTIWAESEPGKGSNFRFRVQLPLASGIPSEMDTTAVAVEPIRPLRILLAEDNPANQKLATYILQERGHTIDIASEGQEAARMAAQNHYDIVLMDVQMPGMNGFEATAAIRKREDGSRRVPIIAMTAYAMKGDRERCLAAGMDGYLAKPVNGREMIGLVENLAYGLAPAEENTNTQGESTDPLSEKKTLVFDPEEALARCFNSENMVQEMTQSFFEEMDSIFIRMRSALKNGDLIEVGRLGHHIKGTIVYLAAEPAKEAALRVERFCKKNSGTSEEADEAINALERECVRLRTSLMEYQRKTIAAKTRP